MNRLRIRLACATREHQEEIAVEVLPGTTLQQGLALLTPQIAVFLSSARPVATGVWGKIRPPHYLLREGDRIEMYRPLKADPKQARRARVWVKAKR